MPSTLSLFLLVGLSAALQLPIGITTATHEARAPCAVVLTTGSLEGGTAKHSMYTGHKILHSLLGESLHTHAGLLTFLAYVPSMGELVIRIGIYTDTADVHV